MILAIGQTPLDGPGGVAKGAPTFEAVPQDGGQYAARTSDGQYMQVDAAGTVRIVSLPGPPGDWETFLLDAGCAVFWPLRNVPGSPAYRFGATKVPGGG